MLRIILPVFALLATTQAASQVLDTEVQPSPPAVEMHGLETPVLDPDKGYTLQG